MDLFIICYPHIHINGSAPFALAKLRCLGMIMLVVKRSCANCTTRTRLTKAAHSTVYIAQYYIIPPIFIRLRNWWNNIILKKNIFDFFSSFKFDVQSRLDEGYNENEVISRIELDHYKIIDLVSRISNH
ncbi:hypothetical protein DFA_02081 [Cavenderia fasciculata]|uniref:Uncharacterized protein n=1 Tax=Cavenderia fasciculata TaxID=261658 RepID=F4PYM8_CACFS|nr:uncharacterized protein DFA_02081 [Cavenderia fasciculata]EGG19294.1 hypothetical protein DFA_02081 [Cavenderia fasciculata]|eukprot:XP_004357565.1 hypothetical protein DFA_02081 [Cavenderia fasciculata]